MRSLHRANALLSRGIVTVASHILLAQQGIRPLRQAEHTQLLGGFGFKDDVSRKLLSRTGLGEDLAPRRTGDSAVAVLPCCAASLPARRPASPFVPTVATASKLGRSGPSTRSTDVHRQSKTLSLSAGSLHTVHRFERGNGGRVRSRTQREMISHGERDVARVG